MTKTGIRQMVPTGLFLKSHQLRIALTRLPPHKVPTDAGIPILVNTNELCYVKEFQ